MNPSETYVTIIYFVSVFVIGITGNLWVICSILRMLYKSWSPINNVFQHMSLYILCLSIVDFMMLCMTPMTIGYFLASTWTFGHYACKIFWAVENINKLLSVALLAVMSFERFLAVCRPFHFSCCRRNRFCNVFFVATVLLILIGFLCSPIIYHAEVRHTELYVDEYNASAGTYEVYQCMSELPHDFMLFFVFYMASCAFFIPGIVITVCYIFLIRHLRNKNGKNSTFVTSYTSGVVRNILRVVIFHFVCWAPFWFFSVFFAAIPFLVDVSNWEFFYTESTNQLRMFASFLPYLNSAGNWIFYAGMNRELRETVACKPNRYKSKCSQFTTRTYNVELEALSPSESTIPV